MSPFRANLINALNRHVMRIYYPYGEDSGVDADDEPRLDPVKHAYLWCVFALMVGLMYLDVGRWLSRLRPRHWRKPTPEEIDEFNLPRR